MLIDENTTASLLARLTEGEQVETPIAQDSTSETVTPSEQVENREQTAQEVHVTEQKTIPYERFQTVNSAKKDYQRKLEESNKEVARLQKELESGRSNRNQEPDDEYQKLLNDILGEPEGQKVDKRYESLETRVRSFEMKEAEASLASIVNTEQKKHGDLDPDLVAAIVYQAIGKDPNADLDDEVDKLRQFIGYAQTKAVRKAPEVVQQTVSAPVRPGFTGSKTTATTTDKSDNKPGTLANARAALYEYLKK